MITWLNFLVIKILASSKRKTDIENDLKQDV